MKPFINNNWERINYPSKIEVGKDLTNNLTIALHVFVY